MPGGAGMLTTAANALAVTPTMEDYMQDKSIDKVEFHSPINIEGSWGGRNLHKDALSTMELWFSSRDASRGSIEWIVCPDTDDEMVEEIGLRFGVNPHGKRTLEDYDGVFSLPDQAMDLLEKHGIDCAEMRRVLAD
jgi:hypothetical protein